MAKLQKEDILKLARLSRIRIADDEVPRYQEELNAILEYVEQLQSLDLEGVEPTYQVTGLQNVFRPDQLFDYGPKPKDLLRNAPDIQDAHVKVRRVL